uniref:Uncharacterized protein n=1 Tax=Siphoviridae sp. cttm829 TaxID=2825707 RepID=A0A8S5PEJ7_9CAUD|nr:MAG TPA: hypothetical protein [Siphoviridae sp. cttm829]
MNRFIYNIGTKIFCFIVIYYRLAMYLCFSYSHRR